MATTLEKCVKIEKAVGISYEQVHILHNEFKKTLQDKSRIA